jgi:hypothetical protein
VQVSSFAPSTIIISPPAVEEQTTYRNFACLRMRRSLHQRFDQFPKSPNR